MDSQTNQMVSGGNEKLIMESLKWMTDTEESASVSIPSKSLEVSYLTITDYDAAFWKICTINSWNLPCYWICCLDKEEKGLNEE